MFRALHGETGANKKKNTISNALDQLTVWEPFLGCLATSQATSPFGSSISDPCAQRQLLSGLWQPLMCEHLAASADLSAANRQTGSSKSSVDVHVATLWC